ncbi:ThiF family adenylyltransferase [Micropruina sonneratiae]|uniref:ThiF family adenylyltransferase n=1 Tax=Micropruina sonneratiae TaxID=2986940 RepID=UPI002227EB4E|nr:ThiF family adenylyltransferase [Micropruina sp. KQZ13P-5]MCW3157389.1 ThiF family adenylyltransferase [Micropruina sp. KQZ13P-5]
MSLPPLVPATGSLSADDLGRYSRQVILGELGIDGQRRLAAARVLVIGAGGLGSPVLLYLAAAGVGTLGVVDSDDVETSNLHRQVIHSTAAVGRPKVDSAADAITALNPGVQVRRHRLRLTADTLAGLLPDYDLVVDGSDNFPTRYLVNDGCAAAGKPLVWGSVLGFAAQVAVFWAGVNGGVQLRDVFPEPPAAGEVPSCAEAGVVGAVCAQAGSVMAMETVKLITGIGRTLLGRVLVIDALAGRWDEVPVRGGAAAAGGTVPTGPAGEKATDEGGPTPAGTPDTGGSADDARTSPERPAPSATPAGAGTPSGEGRDVILPGADGYLLLDVRSPAEVAERPVRGARNVPLAELLAAPPDLPSDRPVLVICRSGARAAIAAESLRARGRTDVRVLDGGLLALDAAVAAGVQGSASLNPTCELA